MQPTFKYIMHLDVKMIGKLTYFGSLRFKKCEIKQIIGSSFTKKAWFKLEPRKH